MMQQSVAPMDIDNSEVPEPDIPPEFAEAVSMEEEVVPDWIIDVQPLIDFINSVSFLKSK